MLERVRIKNFQKHSKIDIDLSTTITVITGPSDCGKSACFNALQWVLLNRPQGKAFIRHDQSSAAVRVVLDDCVVDRKRSDSINEYRLDGNVLSSFGTKVPSVVQDKTKIDEVNFQGQHDPLFWFSLSSTQVAAEISKLVDLGEVAAIMKELSTRDKKLASTIEGVKYAKDQAQADIDRLAFIPKIEALVDKATDLEAKQSEVLDEVQRLCDAQDQLKSINLVLANAPTIRKQLKSIDHSTKKMEELQARHDRLQDLVKSIDAINKEVTSLRRELKKRPTQICPECKRPL